MRMGSLRSKSESAGKALGEEGSVSSWLARLFVHDGEELRGSFELSSGVYRIGRDTSSAVRILDTRASRHHCEIEASQDGFLLRDLKSKNGTYVNGHAVEEKWLEDGDVVTVGEWTLRFSLQRKGGDLERRSLVELSPDEGMESQVNLTITSAQAERLYETFGASEDQETLDAKRRDILGTLYEAGNAIHTLKSLPDLMETLLELVFEVVPADRGFVMLADEETDELIPQAMRNELGEEGQRITVSSTIANMVYKQNTSVLTQDATRDARFKSGQSVVIHSIRSAMCVPLATPNRVHGIFYVDTKFSSGMYDEDHLRLLTAIGRQAGIAIENAKLYEEQKATFESLMETLAATIDARDPMTAGHSQRVAEYSTGIAKALGLPQEEQESIRYAAYLHDYGKIGVRDAVLRKPGRLTDEEYEEIKQHAAYTASILSKIRFGKKYREIPEVASFHHERVDGTGYPEGLKGEEIPLGAKIIAVADVFDALISERHYKPAMSIEEAYKTLEDAKGKHFDPEIVDAFRRYHSSVASPPPLEKPTEVG